MDFTTVGTVIGITVICYLVGMIAKASKLDDKWIPVISALAGFVLGIAGLYIIPDFPAGDLINAAAVGIASGLAATGVNQVYKQQANSNEGE